MLKPADAAFLNALQAALPALDLGEAEPRYLEEPRGRWTGIAGAVARPRDLDEVAGVVRFCAEAGVGLIPYGGGTGLVGGQVLPEGTLPLVISLERMKAVREIDPRGNVLIVEAGATLAEVQAAAEGAGRLFPLTLASQGTARIGGCLSTNAGGVNVLRYGNARELCFGVEAVLADGTVLRGLKRLRKDNTGYDLKDLLIGAEGTLGVITACALRLFPRPAAEGTAMLVVDSPSAALELLGMAEARMPGCVSAFELIAQQGLLFLDATMPDLRQPLAERPAWSVLIEVGLPQGLDPEAVLAELFEAALEAGLVSDGVIAQSAAQRDAMWTLRESLPEGNKRIGAISSHDISVPLSSLPLFIEEARAAVNAMGDFRINCFGHVGDGNLHFNVFPPEGKSKAEFAGQARAIATRVHEVVDALGGSVSAEHGIGRLKVDDLERFGDTGKLTAMRAIKAALDPQGIMNPGAVLRG
ncbi:FAD-binding oxidoreductase [Phaeovulum sp. W22_SRMD_FR3]|uniref:FAD-binding oxidoreductase n=1 Tax=Phaeovulum sp. W22_SRMD_FR3 TaxID=3240274 RepID=UPI003F9927ED